MPPWFRIIPAMNEKSILTDIFSSKEFTQEELSKIIPEFKKVEFSKSEYILQQGNTANLGLRFSSESQPKKTSRH